MNPYLVYQTMYRRAKMDIVIPENDKLNHANVSKEAGEEWKQMSSEEKQVFVDESVRLALYHKIQYPIYKYVPKKKNRKNGKHKLPENAEAPGEETAADAVPPPAKRRRTTKRSPAKPRVKREVYSPVPQPNCLPAYSPVAQLGVASNQVFINQMVKSEAYSPVQQPNCLPATSSVPQLGITSNPVFSNEMVS